jgi:hypothetical protein
MSTFKEKSQVFIFGMMAGLIIAGGFFVLKLDDYFKELNLYKNVVKTFYLRSKTSETNIQPNHFDSAGEAAPMDTGKKANKSNRDSKKTAYFETEQIANADSSIHKYAKDSTVVDPNYSEEIVVRKDELLTFKILEVINLTPSASVNTTSDSLMQKVSGIRDDRNNSKLFFNVEVWQSPLNYKGYKMSNYKLVLYGLTSVEGLKVYKLDNDVYLKKMSSIYKLERSTEFRPYQVVVDAAIINKLK